jgi:hypothetical protein
VSLSFRVSNASCCSGLHSQAAFSFNKPLSGFAIVAKFGMNFRNQEHVCKKVWACFRLDRSGILVMARVPCQGLRQYHRWKCDVLGSVLPGSRRRIWLASSVA